MGFLMSELEHEVDVTEDDDGNAFGECRACCWAVSGSLARVDELRGDVAEWADEYAKIKGLFEKSERVRAGYLEQKEKLRAQRDDYSLALSRVRLALLEGGQDAASRCRKALAEMDTWANSEPSSGTGSHASSVDKPSVFGVGGLG